jgi:GNAT superfamily N-acetyltransferase
MAHASPNADFQVEPGRPRDIFFFILEIVSGAWRHHFGEQFSSLPMTEKEFGKRCAKAILEQLLPFWRAPRQQFVVVRQQHQVVGAALSQTIVHRGAPPLTTIDVVVVAEKWRRQGIARAFVVYFQKRSPPGASLECYCMPKSRTMARVVKRLGFVRTHKFSKVELGNDQYVLLPERWEWRIGCASTSHHHADASGVELPELDRSRTTA